MVDPSGFGKLVPGFDFLEGLVKNAGAAMPGSQTMRSGRIGLPRAKATAFSADCTSMA